MIDTQICCDKGGQLPIIDNKASAGGGDNDDDRICPEPSSPPGKSLAASQGPELGGGQRKIRKESILIFLGLPSTLWEVSHQSHGSGKQCPSKREPHPTPQITLLHPAS